MRASSEPILTVLSQPIDLLLALVSLVTQSFPQYLLEIASRNKGERLIFTEDLFAVDAAAREDIARSVRHQPRLIVQIPSWKTI